MKVILINPPVCDPTCPYSSLYYLKSYVEAKSKHSVVVKDTNIEWINYLVDNNYTEKFLLNVNSLLARFEQENHLSSFDFIHYYKLLNPNIRISNDQTKHAFDIFKNEDAFYNIDKYLFASEIIKNWFQLLSAVSFPASFNRFNYDFGIFRCKSKISDLLMPISNKELGFFDDYLEMSLFSYIEKQKADVIGISIPLKSQLYFSIHLARKIRNTFPNIKLISGGTCLHQIYKQTRNNGNVDDLFELFDIFTASIVGEGEEPLLRILNCFEQKSTFDYIPNVIQAINNKVICINNYYYHHKIDDCPPPDYSDVQWEFYLSPEKFISYVPTRGCYWGKCSFCDYGLSEDKSTVAWRYKSIEVAIKEIKYLEKLSRFIYFCVDAVHPRWLLQLSKRIIDENIKIYWGTDIRLDKNYSKEEAILLKKAGCTTISIGFESASPQIIQKINKGNMPSQNITSIINLKKAGIAIYPMTFLGFPGEQYNDALKTIEFLENNYNNFALLPKPGNFYLEGSSHISQNYNNYNINIKDKFRNLDITDGWLWESSMMKSEEHKKLKEKIEQVCCKNEFAMTRPFFGIMYIAKYGLDLFKEFQNIIEANKSMPLNRVTSNFNLNEISNIVTVIDREANTYYNNRFYPTNEIIDKILNSICQIVSVGKHYIQEYNNEICDILTYWVDNNYSRNRYK